MRRFNLWLALIVIGATIWAAIFSHKGPVLEVNFLDVGQGDATYIAMPDGQDALIDGGPKNKVLEELGKVMPYWDHELDLVVVTHNHSDHIGGIPEVLKRYKIKEIWLSGAIHTSDNYIETLRLIKEKNIPTKIVRQGDEKEFDEVKVKVLYPTKSWQGERPENQHEAGVVTKWTYGKFSMLMTGDMETEHLDEMSAANNLSKINVLKVPHHGSATSLTEIFLRKIAPEIAIISVGKNNSFGHPKASILRLLKNSSVKTYRTDQTGTITLESDGMYYQVRER